MGAEAETGTGRGRGRGRGRALLCGSPGVGRSPAVPQVVPDGLLGAWKGVDAADTSRMAQVAPWGVLLGGD